MIENIEEIKNQKMFNYQKKMFNYQNENPHVSKKSVRLSALSKYYTIKTFYRNTIYCKKFLS